MCEFEHGQQTPWGYIIDTETLPDFITPEEFNSFTGNKFAGDVRITANIPSATAAIRNYCGWHISPNVPCGMAYAVRDLKDAFVGQDLLIQLPATYVTSIEKIVLDAVWDTDSETWTGETIDDSSRWDLNGINGLVRVYDVGARDRKSKIFVKYNAGLPTNYQLGAIKELTANRVARAVVDTYGVNSESAGGVSISYNAAYLGHGSAALSNDARETLDTYRVKGVY